jgi:hypothetical protein
MIKHFETISEPFKHPKVKLINKAFKKQTQLFEEDNGIAIQFNGFNSLPEYHEHIIKNFLKSKEFIQERILAENNQPLRLKEHLDVLKFEIKTFRRRYYEQNDEELMLSRIEFLKNSLPVKGDTTALKKNPAILFD